MILKDTIVALATASGVGAIAVIRLSGPDAITIANDCFTSIKENKSLLDQKSHTLHLGHFMDNNRVIDQVLVSVFKNPHSYTGEDTIEISCHGSLYIQQEIIQILLQKGARMADAGEFTLRAFINGKLDLSQAEAVADLISSDSEASHQVAMQQMRGGFSNEIQNLRDQLINFASLIELELDFAEEDVEFADRTEFKKLVARIQLVLKRLIDSFAVGNVIKNGIPVAIVGEPNVGKSTLLNALLNEERAIVSDIAGTTRDTIEDEIIIDGVAYRFIDTAGIRETKDVVESIGIQKTFEKIAQAQVVIYLFDLNGIQYQVSTIKTELASIKNKFPQKQLIVIGNKADTISDENILALKEEIPELIAISAKSKTGIEILTNELIKMVNIGALNNSDTIVTNSRHYDALLKALNEINKVDEAILNNVSSDLMAIDIRETLYYFGLITGEVTNDDLLGNIFANFCIGK
ncbi:tRNA uridine-5-carboxymethylaminomethyl(34) synthesis GTPase MnmE [Wenyingzhuangia marina]|uniref:tRNA modification GTPase MnmE n=1 Tax=Wenyingzhuangia marina TaxID=1195760 RepID=A0A1M5TVZ8_9FLAO|nr:tRNA uridine-5-carboxymethylaminomethyl(34) synthesis GTPase MnmE [Wenyingzhuangia marina]GGF70738.1 tRNA modification GTPase MnmE [Wenyingzhuangia marina]SHH54967.1 tRNA modification GTPase trmE [Wenyingzhuangia marina]